MSPEGTLYAELNHLLRQCISPLPRHAHKRFVWFVLGILLAHSIVLRRIAVAQDRCGGDSLLVASHERRLRRLLNDPRLTWAQTYAPAVRRLVRWNPHHPVYVLIDESGHTDQNRLLMAALWYRGRAVPLAWVQRPFALPADVSYWDLVQTLLQQVAQLLPPALTVTVIADRAFGTPAFTDLVAAFGWQWVVRVQGQTCFRDRQGCRRRLRTVVSQPGQRWYGQGEVFRKSGWRAAAVLAFWDRHHREPLLVVSNRPLRWQLLQLYLRRGAIEHLFRDWKSAGWQWERSQVRDPAHCERVYLGMAWATLLTLCAGRQVARDHLAQAAMPSAQSGLFRLGCERLQQLWHAPSQPPPAWHLTLEETQTWEQQVAQVRIHRRLAMVT
jgi:hypothetical protein